MANDNDAFAEADGTVNEIGDLIAEWRGNGSKRLELPSLIEQIEELATDYTGEDLTESDDDDTGED